MFPPLVEVTAVPLVDPEATAKEGERSEYNNSNNIWSDLKLVLTFKEVLKICNGGDAAYMNIILLVTKIWSLVKLH